MAKRTFLHTVALLAFAALALSGCVGGEALLGGLSATPSRITPNGDRVDDTASIAYTLSRPARVSIHLVDERNQRYTLRQDEPRPAGAYTAEFDGSVALSGGEDLRQVAPAGQYAVVVSAVDEAGRREEQQGRLAIAEPDRALPTLTSVVADPANISPYDPVLQAETRVAYQVAKPATITLYVVDADGQRTRISEPVRREAGAFTEAWNGLVRDKVPKAGTYTCVVQAKDAAGNVVEKGTSVTVSGTEEPDASVTHVEFSPRQVMKGETVQVSITVRNTGNITLHSQGPAPGYVYTTRDTYASIEGGRYADKVHLWRVGVDWAGGLGAEGARYPYRWGFGKDLAPGEEVTVVGYIRILEDSPQMRFYAGLIHEKVKYQVDKVGQQIIEVSK
ncbi:MAG: hypothetical protein ACYC3S_06465 [Chloroflexota bacterium]